MDIGANDDAITLQMDGKVLELGEGGENHLPKLNTNNKQENEMDLKTIALSLGLPETATEAQVQAKIAELKSAENSLAESRRSSITLAVDTAIKEKKITADKKQHFLDLGDKVGLESLQATLDAMAPMTKLSNAIDKGNGGVSEYKKLSEVPADQLVSLRENEPETYKKLYKAEYGIECEF